MAYKKEDFDKLMAKVDRIDHRVKEYLEDTGYEKWSRVHATVVPSSEFIFSIYETERRYIVCLEWKPDALAKTYEISMVPMPDKADWSDPNNVVAESVYPPRYRRSSGRPRKRRRKNANE
ncbi:uncharacterized protein [Solanum lycopersicum]|uniref:uncharacterized protein n=1 Tax=Solanum lycopersicum TaxID=4081 RepID=UPI0037490ADD